MPDRKETLPRLTDRIGLGGSRLQVSPVCLGYAQSPAMIPAALDSGVNFFFITADLQWPIYEGVSRLTRPPLWSDGSGVNYVDIFSPCRGSQGETHWGDRQSFD